LVELGGLKPSMVHDIFTMVTSPILTYSSMVWWLRVKNVSRMELSKLQRLACLAITGAMKTTPTAATEILLFT